jgi:conjugal transfer pilus assembly protein TraD
MSWSRQTASGRTDAANPYRRRSARRMLYSAAVMAALIVSPTGAVVLILAAAMVTRAGIFLARRGRALSSQRRAGELGAADETLTIGRDVRSGDRVAIGDRALAAHGLVLGASGAGKTTTLMAIASNQIAKHRPVVVIDLKGSPGFARDLQHAAARAGRGLTVWTLDGGAAWNPLKHGNATELKDKLIATEHFTEPHYKRAAERYLQTAIQVLQELSPGRAVTLHGVVELLDPQRLAAASGALPAVRADSVRDYVRSLAPDQVSAVRGLASRLALITESHTGPFLDTSAGLLPELDLRQSLDGGDVVLFSLNSSTYGQLAGQIGTMAVQDLVTAAGARLTRGGPLAQATVVIDEFSALGSDNVLALLARGRESRVGVLLATQELSDLDRAGRGFREQVLGNTAVKIAHRQDVPTSAESVSRLAGSVKDWERTYTQRSGGGIYGRSSHGSSARLVDRPLVEPAEAQSMRTGEAVITTKVPRAETHVIRVHPPARDRQASGRLP